jgi:DNA polymerase III sliding clamp (beta) subunit (PCNA family)
MFKIQIAKSNLHPALAACCTVVDAKSAMSSAQCIMIDAVGSEVKMRVMGYHQTIEKSCLTLAPSSTGSILVDATDLLKRVDALADGEITITEAKSNIEIRHGSAKYTLPKYDTSAALPMPSVEAQGSEIDARAFAALLGRMAPAMSREESRANMYGVNVTANGGKMTAMATDSNVAAVATITFDGTISATIPSPAVTQIQKVLAKVDGSARVAVVGKSLYVFADGLTYSTLFASDEFPPVHDIMPARTGLTLRAKRGDMMTSIKAVDIIGLKDERIHIRSCPDGIRLGGSSKEGATAYRTIEGACDIQSSLQAKYLSKLLDFIGGEHVTIWQEEAGRTMADLPKTMVAESEDGALFLVMPLRYDEEDLSTDTIKD